MRIRALSKNIVFGMTTYSGLNRLARAVAKRQLLILGYHGVVSEDHPEEPYRCRNAVSRRELRFQLEAVARRFNPVSLSEVRAWVRDGSSLPESPVLVTFDDGYRNNLELAAPEFARVGIPGMVAVATGLIGTRELLWTHEIDERVLGWPRKRIPLPNSRAEAEVPRERAARSALAERIRAACKALPTEQARRYLECLREDELQLSELQHQLYDFMTWDDVRDIRQQGWAVSSHTVSHPILSRLSGTELQSELDASKLRIEAEVGEGCVSVVYPNGAGEDVNSDVIQATEKAGYDVGFMLTGSAFNPYPLRNGPFQLDRQCVTGQLSNNAFHFHLSGLRRTVSRLAS